MFMSFILRHFYFVTHLNSMYSLSTYILYTNYLQGTKATTIYSIMYINILPTVIHRCYGS